MAGLLTYFGETSPYRFDLQVNSWFYLRHRYTDNFYDTQGSTVAIPYMDGAFDVFRNERNRRPYGRITQPVDLFANDGDMDTLRNQIIYMQSWGVQKLYYQPTIDSSNPRFCFAKLQSINLQSGQHGDYMLHGQLTWVTDQPYWFEDNEESQEISASGTETDTDITNDGRAAALPLITIAPAASQTCENPTIQRLINDTVVDEIVYTGTLTDTDTLVIDCGNKTVLLNDADSYTSSNFDFNNANWLQLEAGDNLIRVVFEDAGDEATVTLNWNNTY